MKYVSKMWSLSVALLTAAVLAGCGGGGGGGGGSTARATFVLTNDTAAAGLTAGIVAKDSSSGSVPVEDIQSLTVTVTKITLQQCGESDDEHGADEQETVHVQDFAFDPTSVKIEKGGTVRFEWDTDTAHTITSGSAGDGDAGALFDESGAGTGNVVELVFEDEGVFPYFSSNEQDISEGMSGVVEVVADDDANEPNDDDNDASESESDLQHNGPRDGGEDDEGASVIVYEGALDVNLLDLSTLSETLTAAEIPAGRYCRIILEIENPRLVLVADPNTEITDIHLTANGRLFIKDRFEIAEGDDVIIVINFGGIHLVPNGNGGYVLTPKLRAEVDAGDQETKIEGEIDSVNQDTKIIEMFTVGGEESFEVLVGDSTVIKTDDDSDDEVRTEGGEVLLTLADLQPGMHIEVEGTVDEAGQVLAEEIEVRDSDIVAPPAVP